MAAQPHAATGRASPVTPREQLDHCLARLVDAVLAGNDSAARAAFADAKALPALVEVRYEAHLWAAQEAADWARITDDQLDGTYTHVAGHPTRARPRATQ